MVLWDMFVAVDPIRTARSRVTTSSASTDSLGSVGGASQSACDTGVGLCSSLFSGWVTSTSVRVSHQRQVAPVDEPTTGTGRVWREVAHPDAGGVVGCVDDRSRGPDGTDLADPARAHRRRQLVDVVEPFDAQVEHVGIGGHVVRGEVLGDDVAEARVPVGLLKQPTDRPMVRAPRNCDRAVTGLMTRPTE